MWRLSTYTTKHIYKIDATLNIIDLDDTLKNYSGSSPHSGALGGLLWTQIMGWYDISDNPRPESGKTPNNPFFKNTDYDPRFAKFRASEGQQQLMEGADRILRDRYGGTEGLRNAVMKGQATPEERDLPDAAFLKTRTSDFMESIAGAIVSKNCSDSSAQMSLLAARRAPEAFPRGRTFLSPCLKASTTQSLAKVAFEGVKES